MEKDGNRWVVEGKNTIRMGHDSKNRESTRKESEREEGDGI